MSVINQKEYLKRYLSKADEKPKKKQRKKKQSAGKRTVVIVDDDVDIKSLTPAAEAVELVEEELYDDAPTVAGTTDERPEDVKKLEAYRQGTKWKGLSGTKDTNMADGNILMRRENPERHDSDIDLSPTRSTSRADLDHDLSPVRPRKRHDSDSDHSSPRSKQRNTGTSRHDHRRYDREQQRRKRHTQGNDHSPRRSRPLADDREQHNDLSPPRTESRRGDPKTKRLEQGPVRQGHLSSKSEGSSSGITRHRHDSDSDLSPRRGPVPSEGEGSKYEKTTHRHDSDSDLSPHRGHVSSERGGRHDSDSDLSPQRGHVSSRTEGSNPGRRRGDSDSDLSPRRGSDSDLSPIRSKCMSGKTGSSQGQETDLSPPRPGSDGKMKKTLSGQRAGLQDAKTLKAENEANRRRQDRLFESLAVDDSGRNKTTIFRDKSGKRRDLAPWEREQEKEEEVRKAKENEKFKEWGQGVAQKQNQEQLVEDAAKEMAKPLARYSDDKDLDSLLKEQEREGDPMLAMIRKKKSQEMKLAGIKEKPRYRGPAPPPNRFGIPPGYRWDGVDRSNGFEKKHFARLANKTAMQEVKYKWSVEDM